ncbi:hypothetical protein WN944_022816 [Citrus x changshan-huyou]|uniref:HVA22-like protein n=1 Tax=Citrus x changshan-huyou TaxID=2935761 RepID=A0AAP0N3W7_9ROSI
MALSRSSLTKEVGFQLLFCPLGSNIIVRTACCSVGVALPVYSTFKGIERKDEDEQQKWLIYWAAYGTFSIAEAFADKFLTWAITQAKVDQLRALTLRPFLLTYRAKIDQLRAIEDMPIDTLCKSCCIALNTSPVVSDEVMVDAFLLVHACLGFEVFYLFLDQLQNIDPNKPEGRNAVEDLDGITSDRDTESDLEVEETLIMHVSFGKLSYSCYEPRPYRRISKSYLLE